MIAGSTSELVRLQQRLGITYRQLDWWCRRGWVFDDPAMAQSGSGQPRQLKRSERSRLERMAELVHGGMTPAAAAERARREQESGHIDPTALALAWASGRGECA